MNKELIKRLRKHFEMPDYVKDDHVLICTSNTLARSFIELNIAFENIGKLIKQELKKVLGKNE